MVAKRGLSENIWGEQIYVHLHLTKSVHSVSWLGLAGACVRPSAVLGTRDTPARVPPAGLELT